MAPTQRLVHLWRIRTKDYFEITFGLYMTYSGKIICIEGIPGSGKTTLAESIQKRCEASDLDSFWVVEENREHPVTPAELRRQSGAPDFAERCILSWNNFTHNLKNRIAILEGCAFQSTIRFMFANDIPLEAIRNYTTLFEKTIASVKPNLVLLVTFEPLDDFYQRIDQIREDNWLDKVSAYVSRTPYGKRLHLQGVEGMDYFWSHYQDLCMDLIQQLNMPSLIIDISNRQWSGLDHKVYKWAFECDV